MVHKRPFGDGELHELACKHPRQLEYGNQLDSFVELIPCGAGFAKSQGDKTVAHNYVTDLSNGADKGFDTPGAASRFLWVSNSTIEEYGRSGAVVCSSSSPIHFAPDYPTRVVNQSEEIYSSLLNYPPRKLVSIGPDHQADIPLWGLQDVKNESGDFDTTDPHIAFPEYSGNALIVNGSNKEEFMGTCVISMPDLEPAVSNGDNVGGGSTECNCPDSGSVRCVRQHVMEARENLRAALGDERFRELGFCDMGEEVARKWSKEEEQVFHEVVFSNPVSLNKNFWDHLSLVFPFRTKKDIVSYYFNVFMLRRRAAQNRSYPRNVDSDNDEWQESEEEEDSILESPIARDDLGHNQDNCEEDFHKDDENGDGSYDNNENHNVGDDRGPTDEDEDEDGGVDDESQPQIGKSRTDCSSNPMVQIPFKKPVHNLQDDSCTSYEFQHSEGNSCGPVDIGAGSDYSEHFHGSFDGLSDAKVWNNIEYFTGLEKDVDFLPTCNMIEEVFGEETWNDNARNDRSIS